MTRDLREKVKASLNISQDLTTDQKKSLYELLANLEGELQARDLTISTLKSERLLHSINAPQTGVAVNPNPFFALTRDQRVHPQQQQQRVPTSSYLAAAPDTEPQCRSGSPAGATAASASESNSSQQQHYLGSLQKLIGKQRLAIETANSCLHVSEENNSRLEAKVEELQAELESLRVQQLREEERRRNGEKEELLEPGGKLSDEQTSKYESEIESLKAAVKEEKKLKNDFVLLLLQDRKKLATIYLDEKQRSDELARLLLEEKRKVGKVSSELEEESKRSLAMESEVEGYLRQLSSQREDTKKILKEENLKRCDLEDALRRSRQESDHLRKQLAEAHRVAMSQASSSMPPPPPLAPQQASQSSNSASGSVGGTVTSTGVAGTTVPGSQSQANVYKGNTANSFHVSQDQYISGLKSSQSNLKRTSPNGTKQQQHIEDKSGSDSSATASASEYLRLNHRGGGGGVVTSGPVQTQGPSSSAGVRSTPSGSLLSAQQQQQIGVPPSEPGSAGGGSTSTVKKSSGGVLKGIPPPVPPNKPAISVYKNNSNINSYNVTINQRISE